MSTYTLRNDSLFLDELYIYGSQRVGLSKENRFLARKPLTPTPLAFIPSIKDPLLFSGGQPVQPQPLTLYTKRYELTDWLGNVRVVITNKKTPLQSAPLRYKPDVVSVTDYYAFGSEVRERSYERLEYDFGFNGKEKDDEITGQTGSHIDFGARIYDNRIGRWMSVDPAAAKYPGWSPYAFVRDNPILRIDANGLWDVTVHAYSDREKFGYAIAILKDRNGNEIARYTCKVVGLDRDRTQQNNDTPTGTYQIGDWRGVWYKMDNECAYGYNEGLRLTYLGGEASTDRQGIMFHGGRQTDECDDAPWIDHNEPLQYTYGCFRFFDEDLANMKMLTDQLELNDNKESGGTVTLSNDLIKNSSGSFSIKSDIEYANTALKDASRTLYNEMLNLRTKEDFSNALNKYFNLTINSTEDASYCIEEKSITKERVKLR